MYPTDQTFYTSITNKILYERIPGGQLLDRISRHRKSIPIMLVLAIAIFFVSLLMTDPWVWFPSGVLALIMGREMIDRSNLNLGLISSLAFATVICLMVALLFNFYVDDLGYRLKEIAIAVACLSLGLAIVVSMISHTGLGMNKGMALLSTLFIALFLVTMIILTLLLFDTLGGNTLIVDNRWMMFIITDIGFIILGIWVLMVAIRSSIPLQVGGASR